MSKNYREYAFCMYRGGYPKTCLLNSMDMVAWLCVMLVWKSLKKVQVGKDQEKAQSEKDYILLHTQVISTPSYTSNTSHL